MIRKTIQKTIKNGQKTCAVIGNPIAHSLSPSIHLTFAKQLKINLDYQKYLVKANQLNVFVRDFFEAGGTGLNVTLPFKQAVIELVDELSETAQRCQSVNTLSITAGGKIRGDSTDGEGLILDLKRLGYDFKNRQILILGAGGASVSILSALLKNHAKILLENRSKEKINKVRFLFSEIADIRAFEPTQKIAIDGLICATSQFNPGLLEPILPHLKKEAFIYDLNYAKRAVQTLSFFKQRQFMRRSDGYGMLVGQAAKSFEIWHGILPKIS